MKKTTNELDNFDIVRIDADSLDDEWLVQPSHYFDTAKKLADAKASFDTAKANLSLIEAEIAHDIRSHPNKHKNVKPTEGGIRDAVILHEDYQLALKSMNRAKHRVEIYGAAVTALDHKKKALENLVWLHGQNYFSSPNIPKGMSREEREDLEHNMMVAKTKKARKQHNA